MLEKLFLQIINMSYIGSIVIMFILVARMLLNKAPKKYSYILWAVALIRLIVPISFESVLSMIPVNTTPISNNFLYDTTPYINTEIPNIDQSITGSLSAADVVGSVNPMQVWIFLGSLLWISGIVVLLIYGMVSLRRIKSSLENANCEKDNIYRSDNVETPFVLGLVQPKIYLPAFLSRGEKEYIVLHEQNHIKRFDHVIRFISYLAVCIHWFNPLVWIAFWLSGKDMEMSCDESVINQLGHSVKKDYSQSLLNLATGRRNLGMTPLAFGEGDTKERIKNIINFKQPKFYIIIIAVIMIIVVVIGLISNPKSLEKGDKYTYNGETNINIDNRSFKLEDIPENLAEEFVANAFLYQIVPDFDKLSNVMADIESHRVSTKNKEMFFNDGVYIKSYVLHEISTLSENEYSQNKLDDDELNPLYYYGWQEIVSEYNLTEYEVINAKFTQKHSEQSVALGPQIGDGTYNRSFIIGKSSSHNDYKIYDFGMVTGIGSDINDQMSYDVASDSDNIIDEDSGPHNKNIGYISEFEEFGGTRITFDPIEWITLEDTDRIDELEIEEFDMPNGYYIYNPEIEEIEYEVNENTEYRFIDWGNNFANSEEERFHYSTRDSEEFIEYINTYSDKAVNVPFWITTKDGVVQIIEEQYVP